MTRDDERDGATTLLAAPNVPDRTVLGRRVRRHRHRELVRSLDAAEAAVPAGRPVHAITDDHGAREHPKVPARLARRPRRTSRPTPTSGPWPDAVEGLFSAPIRRGVLRPIVGPRAAVHRRTDEHDDDPAPFLRTETAGRITAELNRPNASVR
jgi:hypothetical protein